MTDNNASWAFGDIVRIRETPDTTLSNVAGRKGTIHGFTTPSASGAVTVGALADDFALNVYIDSLDQDFWLDPSSIELVERPEVMELTVAGKTIRVTQKDGEYKEEIVSPRPWWRFW